MPTSCTAPQATTTWHTAFAAEQAGRDLAINNLTYPNGNSSAYVSFTGVVAPGGTVSWSRAGTYAYCDFPDPETTPFTVSVVATNGSQQKTRILYVKPKPQ